MRLANQPFAHQEQAMNRDIIANVVSSIDNSAPENQGELLSNFVASYYRTVPSEDLLQRQTSELQAISLAHWEFGATRKPGTALVRVYNPHPESHGWQSVNTILEVVVDDSPFITDSLRHAAARLGHTVHLTINPVVHVVRDKSGKMLAVSERGAKGSTLEAYIQLHIDKRTSDDELDMLQREFSAILADVRATTSDWSAMTALVDDTIQQLHAVSKGRKGIQEAAAFLSWLGEDNFTFVASCEFTANGKSFEANKSASLGLLRSKRKGGSLSAKDMVPMTTADTSQTDKTIIVTKSHQRSTVHRDDKLDLVTVSLYDKSGKITSKRCFLGLLTKAAYRHPAADIPLLSERTNRVLRNADLPAGLHEEKSLKDILDAFPRDLVLQCDTDELSTIAIGILGLQDRQRVRLFGQKDRYGRFYNCLVYIPRDKYGRELRLAVQDVLSKALGGVEVEFDTSFSSNSALARINYVIWGEENACKDDQDINWSALETKISAIAHGWDEQFSDAVRDHFGDEYGNTLLLKYEGGFSSGYTASYPAANAVLDVARIEEIKQANDISMSFFQPPFADKDLVHFKLYAPDSPIILSDVLPVLENMGLRVEGENPHVIETRGGKAYWMHEFILRTRDGSKIDSVASATRFMECFEGVWHGNVENDSFNRLICYISDSLCNNPQIARTLISLFEARFNPAHAAKATEQMSKLQAELDQQLEGVASLDQDRILRSFRNLIEATLRTNHFQQNAEGEHKSYLSFKLDTTHIDSIPLPRPKFEIFVCSPRMEGVHLRGGSVARGGLRWSDRREDFRTEILGLVKAQMVKNAVIVPVGSKGGFILKKAPASSDRDAFLAEGIACYKTFLRGLLDITDNFVEGDVVPPMDVVRYDGDDPYLVVAADKGTATFSDYANSVSAEYGFWLGDAFASGGSNGYDHKGMGITARGAWESVKRHFREMGVNTQTTDFTVVGVGDMAGDVFGNGMLLSEHIQLVAAFNHMHIFIDPTPDASTSFAERKRLFEMPRSSWSDYNSKLISKGGGIFERSAKSIQLTPEIQKALDISDESLTPNALINAILKSPVDLFWNGGIGTYIKSSSETNADAADRANDSVRVNGSELRCKVIGEGGNLGATQLGRIEFAELGGKHNYTDAIDNSAGVDCSDHEVNIKILLDQVVCSTGQLPADPVHQRNLCPIGRAIG